MRAHARSSSLRLLTLLWGCTSTVVVPVPPRIDLSRNGTPGVIEFDSNADGTINRLNGRVSTEFEGDVSSRLMETKTGASVWSSSAWAKRQIGRVTVSTDRGVNARMNSSDPRQEMLPALVFHLTQDFRPSTVRRRVD